MNNKIENEILNELIKLGENKEDIVNCINNINIRLTWNINSLCLIYSRKNRKWFNGKIIDIFLQQNTREEWLVVSYKKNIQKQIQRFNQCVKPIDFHYEYKPIIMKSILKKLKEKPILVQTDSALSQITDITSIKLSYYDNSYNIKSIKNIDPCITYQYPYLESNCVIQSSLDSNIIYFFNTGHNFNYKYIINTKEWEKIAVVPEEYEIKVYKIIKCFYLNYKKNLIGVICSHETKIRVYDEINDEWSCLEMEIKDKVKQLTNNNSDSKSEEGIKISIASLALDTRNMIYHFVDDEQNHFTYNLNSFELCHIADNIPFKSESGSKLIYNEYTHSLIFLFKYFGRGGMEIIYEYDLQKQIWNEWKCKFNNFEPGDWASNYREFGYINLNNLNKIVTFGGCFSALGRGNKINSKYLFELDLNTKTWSVLNIDLYSMTETFEVGAFFVEPFQTDDGYYTINIFDNDWSEDSSCNHVVIKIKGCNVNTDDTDYKEEVELYAPPHSISIKLFYVSEIEDEKNDSQFDRIENNKESGPLIPISTDFRSKGIEILKGNTYNIKYIEISGELARHNSNQSCIVQSVYDLNILYFFNASYMDYKYNMKTKKWKRIAEMDKEYKVSGCRDKNAFYIDVKKGLIGITGDWNTNNNTDIKIKRFIRIYNEFTDEWTYEPLINPQTQQKHWEISCGAIALDSKNKIYHIVTFSNHITYNIHTKEWKDLHTYFSGHSDACLIYDKYDETLYYIGCFDEIRCYKINENNGWSTESLECDNFEPSNTKYEKFGVLHLNGMHKILTFGGRLGYKDVNYIFELDLKKKKWKLLDPQIYKLPQKMSIGHMIAQQETDNGQYKVDILDRRWCGSADSNQVRLIMCIDQHKITSNDNKIYYQGKYVMPQRIEREIREEKEESSEEETI